MLGGGVTGGSGGNISNGGSAPDIVIGANSSAVYEVDRSQSVDFAEQTGTAVDADSGLGYVTVTPLPAGTLFTETQSGLDVTWSTYSVTVTIGGTNFPVNFNAGDTRAVVIEKVPVGASLSATATIGVSSTNPGAALGYSSLTASTLSPVTIQSGSNAITMWVQYPLECHISTAYQADASITGTPPAYYTNAGPATLAEVTASYTDSSTGSNMRFTGWSLTDGGPVVIAGHSIPAGQYKGKLSLWANYDIGSLPAFSIDIAPPASAAPVPDASSPWALDNLTDSFTLTPSTSAGSFPSGTTFHWEIEASGGSLITRTTAAGESCSVSPASLGLNESSMGTLTSPAAVTVRCTARNDLMDADEDAPAVTQNMFLGCTIPAFTVQISPPSSYKSAKSDESDPANPKYALVNKTDLFTLTPVPTASGAAFPAGTTFSWTVMVFAGSSPCSYSPADTTAGTNASFSFSDTGVPEADIGHTTSAANPIIVICTASNPRALVTVDGNGSASAFVLQTIPDFTISVSLDTAGYNAANSDLTGTDPLYALVNMGKDFTLTATPGSGSFPAGTEFEWTVLGTTLTGSTHKGRVITISPTAMGLTDTQGLTNSVSAAKNAPTGISISCTAKSANAVADVDGTDRTVNVYRLTIPAYKITVTPPADLETEGSGTNTVYIVSNADLTDTSKQFRLKVEPVNSGDTIPSGTQFTWSFDTTASATNPRDVEIGTMCGITAAPATATAYTITCTASLTGAKAPTSPATATVKLKRKIIGSKPAPDAVGDIVFTDGSAMTYTEFSALDTATQNAKKTDAIAVIFDASNKLGVGLVQGTSLKWSDSLMTGNITGLQCTPSEKGSGKAGDTSVSFTGATDGSTNLTTARTAFSMNPISNDCPAWNWIENYATAAGLTGTYASGWYMPSIKELCDLYKVKNTVNSSIGKAGGTQMSNDYWSSSQSASSVSCAWSVEFESGNLNDYHKTNTMSVRAVRKFD